MKVVIIKGCRACPFGEKTASSDGKEMLWCFYNRLHPIPLGDREEYTDDKISETCKIIDSMSSVCITCHHCGEIHGYVIAEETINNKFGQLTCKSCGKQIFWNMKTGDAEDVFDFMGKK